VSTVEIGAVAELTRRLKRDLVRTWKEGMPEEAIDLIPMTMALRRGEIVAQLMAPPGPLGLRYACKAAAGFFRADEVWALSDSVMCSGSERDRNTIKPGQLVDEWRAGQREGLSECIVAVRMPRDGEATAQQWDYTRDGNTLHWQEPYLFGVFDGELLDYAREGWAEVEHIWEDLRSLFLGAAKETDMGDAPEDEIFDRGAAVFASQVLGSSISVHLPGEQMPLVYADGEQVEILVIGG
jgi:hypothetical protein